MRGLWACAWVVLVSACAGPREGADAPAKAPPAASAVAPEPESKTEEWAGAQPKHADPPSKPEPSAEPADPELDRAIKERFGPRCRLERRCHQLLGIDCGAAVDGPYYYAKPGSLEVLATCGGACMSGKCKDCPPPGWDCPTY